MQDTLIGLRDKIPPSLVRVLRWAVSIASLVLLFYLIRAKSSSIEQFQLPVGWIDLLLIQLLLMGVNYVLEAIRWQMALKSIEAISLKQSLIQVFGGIAFNLIAPFTTGDVFVRLGGIGNKKQAIHALVINRFLIMTLTFLFGAIMFGVVTSLVGSLVVIAAWYLLIRFYFFKSIPRFKYSFFSQIALLSAIRFAVFTYQSFMMIQWFFPELVELVILKGVSIIFLAKSGLPNLFGGLGVRELSGLLYFGDYMPDASQILIPIFFIWIINVAVPSLIGLVVSPQLKFKVG